MKKMIGTVACIIFLIYSNLNSGSITENVIVTIYNNPAPGYMLFGPTDLEGIGLMDNCGKVVHKTNLNHTKMANNLDIQHNYLTYFYRSLFGARMYFAVDENYQIVDTFQISENYYMDDHEFKWLNDGSYIMLGIQSLMIDMSEIVPNGNPNAIVVNNTIQIKNSRDSIIFEWSALDHISITDACSDIDLTAPSIDPYHINSFYLDYDGNLLVSARHTDVIYKINTRTGEIIWRMGGSGSRNNEFTFINDTRNNFTGFSHQHDIKRLPNGNILLFDNGNLKSEKSSRAVEYQLNEGTKTATKVWEYHHTPAIFTETQGGVQRLANESNLICWGNNSAYYILTEVNNEGATALEMTGTNGDINYRILKYLYKMAAYENDILAAGNFNFNGGNRTSNTFVSYNIDTLSGQGKITIEKHDYSAHNKSFSSSAPNEVFEGRWVLKNHLLNYFSGVLSFSLSDISNFEDPFKLKVYYRAREGFGSFSELITDYDADRNRLLVRANGAGEYIIGIVSVQSPVLYSPSDNSIDLPTSLTLQWRRVSDAASYRLQVATNPNFTNIVRDSSNIRDTLLLVRNLSESIKYYWRVKAEYQNTTSNWSNVRSFVTFLSSPILMNPADSSFSNNISGVLNWKINSETIKTLIQISEKKDFSNCVVNEYANGDYYNYKKLKFNTLYYWRAQAVSNLTISDWSLIRSFKTKLDSVKLVSPKNTTKNTDFKDIEFRWQKLSGATNYHYQIAEDSTFFIVTEDYVNLADTSFVIKTVLNPAQIYYWRVMGTNNNQTGYWSLVNTFKTRLGCTELLIPPDGSKNAEVKVDFLWTGVKEAGSYHFVLAVDEQFKTIILDSIVNTNTNLLFTKLNYQTKYFWKVTALNDSSASESCRVNTFTTQENNYISTPVLKLPINNTINSVLKIKFIWESVDKASIYKFELAEDSEFSIISHSAEYSKAESEELNLNYNKKYFWRVKAVSSKSESDWSNVFTLQTKLETSFLLSPVNGGEKVKIRPRFQWKVVPGAASYHLQVSENYNFSSSFDFTSETTEYKAETDLKLDTKYFWKVMALNGELAGDWSEIFDFRTDKLNDVMTGFESGRVRFSPNPCTDYLEIEICDEYCEAPLVELFSINGASVLKKQFSNSKFLRINTGLLDKGVYFLHISFGSDTNTYIILCI